MAKAEYKFRTQLRVRWGECDAQGIAFNGSYMSYLEEGQAAYFRNLGFSIYRIARRGYFDSAVVRTVLEFKAPARVEDILDLYVRVSHIGNTSLHLDIEVYPEDSDRLTSTLQAVYVGFHAETVTTRPVPGEIRELVNHFEATGEVLPLERFPQLAEAAR
ncbi:MAG: thioesterase family protein [Dehalococcoidia bacterium]|nr:thioesterase family protein [Dehalococcoidia bacterium]MDP6228184.1 thioesterase family protein [Dehalococcoidia bacterium]MDP7083170.1 thioesterase family protein [Dehalococcoidia bacterium]MDP7199950.1 thioesterase family protein [Dehalococcoidia bacterium]MDP7509995.1 thioesterase family protein [Dehalococcoidia bacterium]|tara:strand:- start:40 stop:519 length:480 start_codon:yes stop_codon:yes gene_type:complete